MTRKPQDALKKIIEVVIAVIQAIIITVDIAMDHFKKYSARNSRKNRHWITGEEKRTPAKSDSDVNHSS